jgi:hypothetical protein
MQGKMNILVGTSEEMSLCSPYFSASTYCPMADSCEDGNEYSSCIQGLDFTDKLRDYQQLS